MIKQDAVISSVPNNLTNNNSVMVAVKQASFVARHQATWQAFDVLCGQLGVEVSSPIATKSITPSKSSTLTPAFFKKNKSVHSAAHSYPLIQLYRQICQQYALAKQRHYSPQLVAQLHQRMMIGHQLIYQRKTGYLQKILGFIFYGFAATVRQHKRLFWLAFALFYVPLLLMMVGCYLNHDLIYSVMSPAQVAEMASMYDPANRVIGRAAERQADTDVMMFGVYISNNIGIDFQLYASGLFFGVGTIVSTVYNGVVIGAVAGHLTQLGFGSTFWPFVGGHGSFELTAAVIASAAGLRLAQPLISPNPYSRKDAFIIAGKQSIQLLLGAALMTFLAAFIEAFWSSSTLIPNAVKYGVALVLWLLVGGYLLFAGRRTITDEAV